MQISRRGLLATGAILPFGMRGVINVAHARQAVQPRIGDDRSVFDAWFGPGTDEEGFVSYPPLSQGRATYHVAFDDDNRARTIAGDFKHLSGGGIAFNYQNPDEVGQSPYLPEAAVAGQLFLLGVLTTMTGVRSWQDQGGLGTIIVTDRMSVTPAGQIFQDTTVTLETPEVNPIVPIGTSMGPASSEAEWQAWPAGVQMHQSGFNLVDPPVPGSWSVMGGPEIWITPDPALTTQQAAELIGAMLPASELEWTAWVSASPVDETQIRLHQFRSHETGAQFLTAQYVVGDETTGTVNRLHLANAGT